MTIEYKGVPLATPADLRIAIEKYQLANGMRVVLSPDPAVPVVTVYLVFDVGARSEEPGRTGFAHLFEHMMFQGSENAPKGTHDKIVEGNGGLLNGSTHPDFTDYFDVMPSSKLPLALWLESDRMRGLAVTAENLENQREAVKQERRLSVDNRPYSGAVIERWPALAFRNWSNSHSLIGSFEDLDAASVEDVSRFFRTHYAPNNAVMVIAGDIGVPETKQLVETYFGDIPAQPQPPRPDLSEPEQTKPRFDTCEDPHAQVPAVVIGYPGPARRSPQYYAIGVLDMILTAGDSSRFQLNLVKGKQSVIQFEANLGWPFSSPTDYRHPNHYAIMLLHNPMFSGKDIAVQVQEEIDRVHKDGVTPGELERARALLRSTRIVEVQSSVNRARLLAQYELLDGKPDYINTELSEFLAVTPEQLREVAGSYLQASRRSVLEIVPAAEEEGEEDDGGGPSEESGEVRE